MSNCKIKFLKIHNLPYNLHSLDGHNCAFLGHQILGQLLKRKSNFNINIFKLYNNQANGNRGFYYSMLRVDI